jgi:hypothetical protein
LATVLNTLLGALLAIITTIVVEKLRKPVLRFNVRPPFDMDYSNSSNFPARKVRYLNLEVRNIFLPKCFNWMMSRNPALDVWGTMSFHRIEDGKSIFDPMTIRWCHSTEPSTAYKCGVLDTNWLIMIKKRDIQPGESDYLDVAARFDDEKECYAWNNDNYFSNPRFKNPQRQLITGNYIIRVEMRTSGERFVDHFRLINDSAVANFRLEPAQPGDKNKVELKRDNGSLFQST